MSLTCQELVKSVLFLMQLKCTHSLLLEIKMNKMIKMFIENNAY